MKPASPISKGDGKDDNSPLSYFFGLCSVSVNIKESVTTVTCGGRSTEYEVGFDIVLKNYKITQNRLFYEVNLLNAAIRHERLRSRCLIRPQVGPQSRRRFD